jgi:hypothetical protein
LASPTVDRYALVDVPRLFCVLALLVHLGQAISVFRTMA